MGVMVLYSKLNISVISYSFFLKILGKMHVNKPNPFVNFLGNRLCMKEVIVVSTKTSCDYLQRKSIVA